MHSIGCEIHDRDDIIVVRNKNIPAEDFNYIQPKISLPIERVICYLTKYRLKYLKITNDYQLPKDFFNIFKKNPIEDYNYYSLYSKNKLISLLKKDCCLYLDNGITWRSIHPLNRKFYKNIIPYSICYKEKPVGRVCLVHYENSIGLYDFEIYEEYQNQGIGKKFLAFLCDNNSSDNNIAFIQTWSGNKVAKRLYENAGFRLISSDSYYQLHL